MSRNQLTRSGPELTRRPSRGTNVNPFTPIELQRKSRSARTTPAAVSDSPVTSTPLCGDKDLAKPLKVRVYLRVSDFDEFWINISSPETGSTREQHFPLQGRVSRSLWNWFRIFWHGLQVHQSSGRLRLCPQAVTQANGRLCRRVSTLLPNMYMYPSVFRCVGVAVHCSVDTYIHVAPLSWIVFVYVCTCG